MVYDKEFLLNLDKDKNKTIYARITALKFDESPIELIEGRVTQGSINVDGTSAVRRSCSLTIIANNFDYREYYWGLNTKFKLEIGVENRINYSYPKVCWFEQGIYLITQFNTNRSATSFTISIAGKDKMAQLNGEIGGNFESSIDFGQIEEQNLDGTWRIIKLPIHRIIREMIHQYAGEPFHNIIINDLEEYGLELLEYQYDVPMFLYRHIDSPIYTNALLKGEVDCKVDRVNPETKEVERVPIQVKDLENTELEMLVDSLTGTPNPSEVWIWDSEEKKDIPYYFTKIETNQTAGYRTTELIYPGDLIAAAGDTVTSILDKIVEMLGEFEYFYDLAGQFIFQRKKSFINTFWSPIIENEDEEQYVENLAVSSSKSYVFNDGELITAFNNNPNLTNMKNDYSIWGNRTSVQGTEIPIHMRYAIDQKPVYYKNCDGRIFMTDKSIFEEKKAEVKEYTIEVIKNRIQSFNLTYDIPADLQKPIKQPNGSWSAGWWDIRDWATYYELLTQEKPKYTMKWYSKNDLSGCIRALDLNITYTYNLSENNYVWLLIKQPNGLYNPQHGNGNPFDSFGQSCTLYESIYTEDEDYITYPVKNEDNESITKFFQQPYSGCNDSHTYISFLEDDIKQQGNTVYFYNPAFPEFDSFEELLVTQIEKEYQEYLDSGILNFTDWREIIYQMSLDYYKNGHKDDFEYNIITNNYPYYQSGQTGYESYYTDLEGFWRQLYDPEGDSELYYNKDDEYPYWRKDVYESPQSLNFWFDFLDTNGELFQFSVKNVGRRPKVVNDSNVKSIYFRDTPNIIFKESDTDEIMTGYKYIQIPVIDTMFKISIQGKSAKDKLDELIYNHAYCIENATITSIPIYYLEPNTRIYVHDQDTGIDGDYIVSKFTIPLSYNGTMSITATKAAENIV